MAVKKIAFVLGSMGRGGAERVISILSRDYARNGWETDIYMLLSAKTEYTLDPSTRVHDITGGNGSRLSRLPFWLKSIRQLAKKENPDVILSFAARINVIVLLACLGLHKNIAVSERSDPKHDNRGAAGKLLTSLLYPRAATVILQTKRSQSYFRKAVRKKCRIIPNPVEVSTLAGDTDENKIVAVGSLREVKNHAMLIKAFEKVVER